MSPPDSLSSPTTGLCGALTCRCGPSTLSAGVAAFIRLTSPTNPVRSIRGAAVSHAQSPGREPTTSIALRQPYSYPMGIMTPLENAAANR